MSGRLGKHHRLGRHPTVASHSTSSVSTVCICECCLSLYRHCMPPTLLGSVASHSTPLESTVCICECCLSAYRHCMPPTLLGTVASHSTRHCCLSLYIISVYCLYLGVLTDARECGACRMGVRVSPRVARLGLLLLVVGLGFVLKDLMSQTPGWICVSSGKYLSI